MSYIFSYSSDIKLANIGNASFASPARAIVTVLCLYSLFRCCERRLFFNFSKNEVQQ